VSIWDDPEVKPSNNFVSFENAGDKVSGTITAIGKRRFDDGSVAPELRITTDAGDEVTLTAGQIRLKMALADQRPEVGDHLAVVFERAEKRAGGKTLKHFAVSVTRGVAAKTDEPPF
jgi:hypothetical protein